MASMDPLRLLRWCLVVAAGACLLAAAPSAAFRMPKPIDWTIYSKRVDMEKEIRSLLEDSKYMELSECYNEGVVDPNKKGAPVYKATLDVIDIKFPGPVPDEERLRVMLIYGEHGRELISAESGLSFLRRIRALETFAVSGKPTGYDQNEVVKTKFFELVGTDKELVDMLGHVKITLLPMENPNGRDIVETSDQCQRINGRGVDPNRNWEVDWGILEPDYDPSEEYGGTEPFSEPEVMCTLSIAKNRRPHVYVNVHSGMDGYLVPWDHKPFIVKGHERDDKILAKVNSKFCAGKCIHGAGSATVGYRAHGTMGDYVMTYLEPLFYSTFEIYGWTDAPYEECYQMFNPQTEIGMKTIAESYSESILFVMQEILFNDDYDFAKRIASKGDGLQQRGPSEGAGALEHEQLSSLVNAELRVVRHNQYTFVSGAIFVVIAGVVLYFVRRSVSGNTGKPFYAKGGRMKV